MKAAYVVEKKMRLRTVAYLYLMSLHLVSASTAYAMDNVLTCESGRVSGNTSDLSVKEYKNNNPTIIIDRKERTLMFIYSEHNTQWKSKYHIVEEGSEFILAISALHAEKVDIIHFKKTDSSFSILFVAQEGNTMEFGKCWGN